MTTYSVVFQFSLLSTAMANAVSQCAGSCDRKRPSIQSLKSFTNTKSRKLRSLEITRSRTFSSGVACKFSRMWCNPDVRKNFSHGKIRRMFITRYTRGRPKAPMWNPDMPTYVCENRYKASEKTFKRIKNWAACVPEEARVADQRMELDLFSAPLHLRKVKSPFAPVENTPVGTPANVLPSSNASANVCREVMIKKILPS